MKFHRLFNRPCQNTISDHQIRSMAQESATPVTLLPHTESISKKSPCRGDEDDLEIDHKMPSPRILAN